MRKLFGKSHTWIKVVAGIMPIAMLFCDVSLYGTAAKKPCDEKKAGYVITEEHESEKYFADGNYDGTASDYENKNSYTGIKGEQTKKYGAVNVLDIVSDRRYGYVGYMQQGCEPVLEGDPVDETDYAARGYIMDSMVNNTPGTAYSNKTQSQYYFNGNFGSINLGDKGKIVDREWGYYNGYFKKVEAGKGVYALCGNDSEMEYDGNYVTSVVMKSLYGVSTGSHTTTTGYDYVWVETPDVDEKDGPKTTKEQMNDGENIYVYNYGKYKYKNANLLSKLFYGDDTEALENDGGVKVFVRTPEELKAEPDLVENADIIFMAHGADTSCQAAYKAYTKYNGEGAAATSYSTGSNDISFDQVISVYKRVVLKQNLAIVTSHGLTNLSNDYNIKKLIFMLYYVNEKNGDAFGSGREFFKNYLKSCNDDNPVFARVKASADSADSTYSDIKISDIAYIDESTGEFVVDDTYSTNYIDGPLIGDVSVLDKSSAAWKYSGKRTSGWSGAFKDDWLLGWTGGTGSFWNQLQSGQVDENGNI